MSALIFLDLSITFNLVSSPSPKYFAIAGFKTVFHILAVGMFIISLRIIFHVMGHNRYGMNIMIACFVFIVTVHDFCEKKSGRMILKPLTVRQSGILSVREVIETSFLINWFMLCQ